MPGCGIPSSRLGLEVLNNTLDDFGFESYLGFAGEKETVPPKGLHATMEAKLGLGPAQRTL